MRLAPRNVFEIRPAGGIVPPAGLLLLFALYVLGPLAAAPARAQETEVPPADSASAVPPPARELGPPVGFATASDGAAVVDTLPVRLPELELAGLLTEVPASFTYDFGTAGWPDGWSPYGLPPQDVRLLLHGLPFDDLYTGRPRYDLVPLAYTLPPRLAGTHGPHAVTVQTAFRPFLAAEPLTELRYARGDDGLQSVDAVHVQRRRWTLLGQPGFVQVLGGYSGRGAAGEYPGSRLRAARQTLLRLRYEQPGWSVEIRNLHNRRRVGAHGGVIPFEADDYATIFLPTLVEVRRPEAERRTVRNDFAVTGRARLLPGLGEPFTLTAFWTADAFRYRDRIDTLATRGDRVGLSARQRVAAGRHRLLLRAEGWITAVRARAGVGNPGDRSRLHAAVRDSLAFGSAGLVVEGGLHAFGRTLQPRGAARLTYGLGGMDLFAEGSLSGTPPPPMAEGLGRFVLRTGDLPRSRRVLTRLGASWAGGGLDAAAFVFAARTDGGVDYFAVSRSDTSERVVRVLDVGGTRAGAALDAGWRRDAARGLYGTVQPTLFARPAAAGTPEARIDATLPAFYGRGRLGARFVLFRDLHLDVYLEGRLWTAFRSRVYQPQSGLLAVPLEASRRLGPSGTVDLFVEGNIRTAKLFVAYENVLSGTAVMPGTLLVPDYPLPAQRLRLGVYWPIFG